MSHDLLNMPKACDHLIKAERLAIGPDHRTLYSTEIPSQRMTSPINGEAQVRLRFNGVDVPRNHLQFGWDIFWDELSIAPDHRSKIVFRKPVRLRDIVIEARYGTLAPYCRKCGGTDRVVDYTPALNGSLKRATRRTKLVQKALKFVLTSRCRFYPALTCKLRTYTGRKFGVSITEDGVSFEVMNALDNMKQVQSLQARFQRMEPEELLRSVDAVSAVRDPNDPTILHVTVDVSSPAGSSDKLNLGIRISS